MLLEPIQLFTIWVFPIIFAITVHEAAHAYMANYYGDKTAKRLGRLTLNPIKHLDPIGTFVVPIIMVLVVGFAFGWAKPVPIDGRNLRNAKKNMILIAFAGPFSNFIMAVLWGVLLTITYDPHLIFTSASGDLYDKVMQFLIYTSAAGILINIILMVLNLIPIPPLDGSRMLSGILPPRFEIPYSKVEPFGLFIIVALFLLDILTMVLNPIFTQIIQAISAVSNIPFIELNSLLSIISRAA